MRILAIETSCDETAAAIVEDGVTIVSSVIASSTTMHKKYGGIVPEVAAREQLKSIIPVLAENLNLRSTIYDLQSHFDAIAVTVGPGLIGSLLVGVETAKTFAFATGIPLIPVNHVLAHMYANFINHPSVASEGVSFQAQLHKKETPSRPIQPVFPAISLVVSGGHTELFLMKSPKELQWLGGTIDDAAGEAFDKTARLLGFENRGGVAIQQAAKKYKGASIQYEGKLPRPLMYDKTLNFSFSGLKTAVLREWKKCISDSPLGTRHSELVFAFAYEVQEAITDVLVTKTLRAADQYEAKSILVSGGVAANLRLREKFASTIHDLRSTISLHVPPIELCTDNAIYIASYAFFRGKSQDWRTITAIPDLSVECNY